MIRRHTFMRRFLFPFSLVFLSLTILSMADNSLNIFIKNSPENQLQDVFYLPPNTEVVYKTSEFTITVKTNALGFRGKDYSLTKPQNTVRILTVGDSFTYGWGVNNDDTWPAILEKELNKSINAKKVEVLNFGKSGLNPIEYAEIANKYVPIFKPDYVLVGIVEGDDIDQLIPIPPRQIITNPNIEAKRQAVFHDLSNNNGSTELSGITQMVDTALRIYYPHLYKIISKYKPINIRPTLITQMKVLINNLNEEELEKFQKINPVLRKKFMSGDLNPILLGYALTLPDHYVKILDEKDPDIITANQKLIQALTDIKNITEKEGGRVIVLDIPNGIFVSERYMKIQSEMGFRYILDSWKSDTPVNVARREATSAGVEFIPNLQLFRDKCLDGCFYEYDGHLTPKGTKLLATSTMQFLKKIIEEKK